MRISDWSSDVCSSDLIVDGIKRQPVNRAQLLSPMEIERRDGKVFAIGRNLEVKIGRVEKMSKSKKNTVDPGPIVDQYGADAVRWFMLSDSPPERDLPWSESGIEGAWRFVQRLWRLFDDEKSGEGEARDAAIDRKLHQTIAGVAEDIEALSFNKADEIGRASWRERVCQYG